MCLTTRRLIQIIIAGSIVTGCSSDNGNSVASNGNTTFDIAKGDNHRPSDDQSSQPGELVRDGQDTNTGDEENNSDEIACLTPRYEQSTNDIIHIQSTDLNAIERYAQLVDRRREQLLGLAAASNPRDEIKDVYRDNLAHVYKLISDDRLVETFNTDLSYDQTNTSIESLRKRRLWTIMDPANPAKEAGNISLNQEVNLQLNMLAILVQAYRMPATQSDLPIGSPNYYRDEVLRDKIRAGVNFIVDNLYTSSRSPGSNWWFNEIGNPRALLNLLVMSLGEREKRYDIFTVQEVDTILKVVEAWVPDPSKRKSLANFQESGANLADKTAIYMMAAVLRGDDEKIGRAAQILSSTTPIPAIGLTSPLLNIQPYSNKTSDGFHQDGGYIQHYYFSYLGSYGADFISSVVMAADILSGTEHDILSSEGLSNFYSMIEKSIVPQIYNGAMTRTALGRSVSRQHYGEQIAGRSVVTSLAILANAISRSPHAQEKLLGLEERIKGLVKGWATRNEGFMSVLADGSKRNDYLKGVPEPNNPKIRFTYGSQALSSILSDACVLNAEEIVGVVSIPSIARVFARSTSEAPFALDIAMFSESIHAFETGNNENGTGWWQSLGAVYLKNGDNLQFENHFQPTVDPRRLPGTTTDGSGEVLPNANANLRNPNNTKNTSSFAGASVISRSDVSFPFSSSVGFASSTENATRPSNSSGFTPLLSNKSWFLFGDKVVAVGTYIQGGVGPVETIAENRKVSNPDVFPNLTFGSTQSGEADIDLTLGEPKVLPEEIDWVHYSDPNIPNTDIGYVSLADSPPLQALLENRTGTWNEINKGADTSGDLVPRTNRYFSLAYQHGTKPKNGTYSYVLLPGKTVEETRNLANMLRGGISIMRNDAYATAVHDKTTGMIGINAWSNAKDKTGTAIGEPDAMAWVHNRGSVTMRFSSPKLVHIAAADPTRTGNKLSFDLKLNVAEVLEKDATVTVANIDGSGKMNITVDTSEKSGLSHEFVLRLAD